MDNEYCSKGREIVRHEAGCVFCKVSKPLIPLLERICIGHTMIGVPITEPLTCYDGQPCDLMSPEERYIHAMKHIAKFNAGKEGFEEWTGQPYPEP